MHVPTNAMNQQGALLSLFVLFFYQKTTPGVRKTTRKAKKSGDEEDDEDGDNDDDEDNDDVDEMSIMEKCRKAEAASKSKYGSMCRCVDRQCKQSEINRIQINSLISVN